MRSGPRRELGARGDLRVNISDPLAAKMVGKLPHLGHSTSFQIGFRSANETLQEL
jgi:hypothetical protein